MTIVNYYNLLQVDKAADATAITKAISEKRRFWQPKTSHPKLETRQAAEQAIQHIAQAETTLLNAANRADYDRQLGAQVDAPTPVESGPAQGRDWVRIAIEYVQAGNANNGNYAAREATSQQPENPEAWFWRGVSSEMLGNARDAEFELTEAIRLNPNEAFYHGEIGDLYRANELWGKAADAYQRACDLDPSRPYYEAARGVSIGGGGDIKRALPIIKTAYEKDKDNEDIRYWYGLVLMASVTDSWSRYNDGSQSILSEAQLKYTKRQLGTIDGLKIKDREFLSDLDEVKLNMERAETVKFWSLQGIGGLILGEIATFIAMLIAFSVGGGGILFGIIFLLLMVVWVAVFVNTHRMPGWKWNYKHSPNYVRQTGLQ